MLNHFMLKFFKRTPHPATLLDRADPLKIRNLLDDPRLQAVMSSTVPDRSSAESPTSTGHADGEFLLGTAA